MIKQLVLPLAGVAIFIVLVGLLVKNSGNITIPGLPTPVPQANISLSKKEIAIGDKKIFVEIADNERSRERGLGGRSSLDQDTGMLFVFDQKGISPSFRMKDMLIPIDIIWISNNKVVKIDKNVQAPAANTPDADLKVLTPGRPIDYVLEVNAGFSEKNSMKIGSSLDLSKI